MCDCRAAKKEKILPLQEETALVSMARPVLCYLRYVLNDYAVFLL
jgi:hypothetical protein